MTDSITIVLIFLSSYVSTILIFLNFLALLPRLENRYWFFWWLKNKKQFMSLNVSKDYKKHVESIHVLNGSQLFYVIKASNTFFLKRDEETGNLIIPQLSKIIKDPNAPKEFFLKQKIDKAYTTVAFDLQTAIPIINHGFIYIVVGPSGTLNHNLIYYQGSIKLSVFDQSLKIQNLMFERTWNQKFEQINNSLKK